MDLSINLANEVGHQTHAVFVHAGGSLPDTAPLSQIIRPEAAGEFYHLEKHPPEALRPYDLLKPSKIGVPQSSSISNEGIFSYKHL